MDIGSSSVRAVAYGAGGDEEPGDARRAYATANADDLVDCCRAVLAQVGHADELAISCFWHSLLPVDRHGRPLTPILGWSDLSGSPPALDAEAYHRRTGCFLHPSYWPAKIRRVQSDGVRAERYLSFADYLFWRLTGDLRTTVSMASGTGLFDPNDLDWDEETLDALGLERSRLPPVSDDSVAGVWPALGDGACSNVGTGCTTRDRAAVTIGTSAALRVVSAAPAAEPRPGLFCYRLDEHRFCEGGALSDGGNLHAWLGQLLRDPGEQRLAGREAAGHGLVFLPFLGGERSLGWDPGRRGLIRGLTFATNGPDIAQAALEGVCYRLADVCDALGGVESVVATGGALLANADWVQILADVLGRPLEVSAVAEGSARGAASIVRARLGLPEAPAPIAGVAAPRPERHERHLVAREEQRRAMAGDRLP